MKRTFSVLVFLSTLAACSHSPKTQAPVAPEGHLNSASPSQTREPQDERNIAEWQEQRHKNAFDWPVDDARMTRGFLPNRRKPHLGIDLAAPKGTRILSSQDGTVIYTGRDFHGFGRMVMVEGNNGWATLYAHLSAIHVKEGQTVSQGDLIGSMGRTGRATGVHLHFEIRTAQGPVDPLQYLPGGSRLAQK